MHKAIRGDKAAGVFGAVAVLTFCCGFLVLQVACGEAGLNETASEAVQSLQLGEESPSLDEAAPFSVRCATPLHSIVYPGITEAIGHVVLDIQKDAIGNASDASVVASIRVNGPSSDSAIYLAEASFDIPQETADGQSSVSMPIEIRWSGLDANGHLVQPMLHFEMAVDLDLVATGDEPGSFEIVGSTDISFPVVSRDPALFDRRSYLLEELAWENEANRICEETQEDDNVKAELSGLPRSGLPLALDHHGLVAKLGGPRTHFKVPDVGDEVLGPVERVMAFATYYRDLFGIDNPIVELDNQRVRRVRGGYVIELSQRSRQGLPVFNHGLSAVVLESGEIRSVRSTLTSVGTFDSSNILNEADATRIALESILMSPNVDTPSQNVIETELGVYVDDTDQRRLSWRIRLDDNATDAWEVYIDAVDGSVVESHFRGLHAGPYEIQYTNVPLTQPGLRIYEYPSSWFYGTWLGDSYRLKQHTQAVLDYYDYSLGRDGWDDGWEPSLHEAQTQTNWDGNTGCSLTRLGRVLVRHDDVCLDILGHEYGHLVSISDLDGGYGAGTQPNAISEGFADYLGEMVEFYHLGAAPDWIVGTQLAPGYDTCSPYRHLDDPTLDGRPSHWNDAMQNGDSHDQSGPLEKAGWLMGRETSEGWEAFAGISTLGIGANDSGVLWHDTQKQRFQSDTDFRDFREEMISWAFYEMFQYQMDKAITVRNALNAVGIFSNTVMESIETSAAPAIDNLTVNSQWRKYAHFVYPVGEDEGYLYQTYRTCAFTGSCQWSSPSHVGYSRMAPSSVIFEDAIWVFTKYDLNNQIQCHRLTSSGAWNYCPSFSVTPVTDSPPTATVYNGLVFLLFKAPGSGAQALQYQMYNPSSGIWSTTYSLSSTTTTGPSATGVISNRFYVVYNSGNGIKIRGYGLRGWLLVEDTPITSTMASNHQPAAAVFRDRLHVALPKNGGTDRIYYTSKCWSGVGTCTYRPGEWTAFVQQDDISHGYLRLLTDIDSRLYFLFGASEPDPATFFSWTSKASE